MESNSQVKLDLSIFSADFGRLGEQVAEATKADADCIRVDVIYGHSFLDLCFTEAIYLGQGCLLPARETNGQRLSQDIFA